MTRYCKCNNFTCRHPACDKRLRVGGLEWLDEETGDVHTSIYCEYGTGYTVGDVALKQLQLIGTGSETSQSGKAKPIDASDGGLAKVAEQIKETIVLDGAKTRALIQAEDNKTRRTIKNRQGQARERFSVNTQEAAHLIWEKYRKRKDIKPTTKGRKLQYADVFRYAKQELASLEEPILAAEDFIRCLGARSDRIRRNSAKKPRK